VAHAALTPGEFALSAAGLRVLRGGRAILDGFDVALPTHRLIAVIGPNGAGKSTFFNCLTGVRRPSSGRILFNGEDITGLPPNRISQKGIARSYQITNILPNATALENVRIAAQSRRHAWSLLTHHRAYRDIIDKAEAVLHQVSDETDESTIDLAVTGDAQRLRGRSYAEIAREGGGILSTMRAVRAASLQQLIDESAPRLQALLAEGVTTIEIKSGYGLTLADEAKMLRAARALAQAYPVTVKTTFLAAHTVPPEFTGRADKYIDTIIDDWLPTLHDEGLIDAVDVFCESIAFNVAQSERLFDAAHDRGL